MANDMVFMGSKLPISQDDIIKETIRRLQEDLSTKIRVLRAANDGMELQLRCNPEKIGKIAGSLFIRIGLKLIKVTYPAFINDSLANINAPVAFIGIRELHEEYLVEKKRVLALVARIEQLRKPKWKPLSLTDFSPGSLGRIEGRS